MSDFTYTGKLKKGRHEVVGLKVFYAGDEVPLTDAGVTLFADKFDDIRPIVPVELVDPPVDSKGKAPTKGKK